VASTTKKMELTGSKLPETLPLDTWRGSGKTSVVWVSRKQMESPA
jgi:hypothetical protein